MLFNPHEHHPVLTKIKTNKSSFYAGYSDGKILQYSFQDYSVIDSEENFKLETIYCPYHSTDVIDFQILADGNIICCTHNEATLYDVTKEASLNLRGH